MLGADENPTFPDTPDQSGTCFIKRRAVCSAAELLNLTPRKIKVPYELSPHSPNFMRLGRESVKLDALDRELLRELQNNARQTNRDLAAATGVSPSTSLERVRILRERGVIRGYRAELDLRAIGRPVQALIAVRIRPPSRPVIEGFREWAARMPETVGLFVTSGPNDFLIHIAVPDTDGLYAFVIDRLTERREVADVQTSVVYEHVQSRYLDPAPGAHAAPGTRSR